MSQIKKQRVKRTRTLKPSDIETTTRIRRRQALSVIGGFIASTTVLAYGRLSYAQTDEDEIYLADKEGRGRYLDNDTGKRGDPYRTGTDTDITTKADPAGGGLQEADVDGDPAGSGADTDGDPTPIGRPRQTGLTDTDEGSGADEAAFGRGNTTDNDSGANADPAYQGGETGSDSALRGRLNDSDTGRFADAAGHGTDSD